MSRPWYRWRTLSPALVCAYSLVVLFTTTTTTTATATAAVTVTAAACGCTNAMWRGEICAMRCIDRGGSKQQANRKKPSVSQKTRKIRRVPHRTGARRALARSEHYFTIFPFLAEQVAVQRYATWLGIAPHMWGLRGALHIPAAMLPSAPQHRTPAPPRSYKVPVHSTDLASDCGAHSKSVGIAVPARLLPSLSALPLLLHRGAFLNSDCGRPRVPSACR